MSNENERSKEESKVLMHFVIPTDWKGTLRGLFWINIGGYALFLSLICISIVFLGMPIDAGIIIEIIIGLSLFTAIYLLIRYASIKYDKIKEPIRVWIREDRFVYKYNYEASFDFYNIRKAAVTIDDKRARLETWYTQMRPNGDTGWIYGLKRANVEKGKYRYYVEKYWIPSMKLIIQQIKKYNPNVEVSWEDRRKKYK